MRRAPKAGAAPRRRAGALVSVLSLAAVVLLPGLAVHAPIAQASLRSAAGGTTVKGPRMWDPLHNRNFATRSSVTVSQTSDLVNQMLQVTWKGFTPSSGLVYDPTSVDYPVMVAECSGLDPTRFSQCFGAGNSGVAGSFSPYGPMNTAYATTEPNGTGQADIQIETGAQNQALGCRAGRPCSLVIVPSQGGNIQNTPPDCRDHSLDAGQTDVGQIAFNSVTGTCSWRDRVIVPLFFAATPTDCQVTTADFTAIGSPMLARAMAQWQAALCAGSDPVTIQYDSAINEPLARQDFLTGVDDVALTTVPAQGRGVHPYTYAPVAISAESIAFWVDNPNTGLPVTHMNLDPRLVAKLLTQSYDFDNEGCGHGVVRQGVGCDNAVDGDPLTLFADPEFAQLNPGLASIRGIDTVGDGYQVPTVVSGDSDLTWEITRWIAADPAAKGFLGGTFDPWGEHVNTDYLGLAVPTTAFAAMDSYPLIAHRYSPVFSLGQVAQYQADNWYPATSWQLELGNYPKLPPEPSGNRALFAILDQADAAAFRFPVASILNHAGRYVTPTAGSMAAALAEMRTSGNHVTQEISTDGSVAAAYPLTMVIYAMVPTGGISRAKAAKIAQFLDFIANNGQRPGGSPGQLPPGYLPLPANLRAQTLAAASAVLSQTGDTPRKRPTAVNPSPTATPTPSRRTSASSGTPGASQGQQGQVSLGYVTNPPPAGAARYAVPILLIAGAALALGGASGMIVGGAGTGAAARLRRLSLRLARRRPWRRKP